MRRRRRGSAGTVAVSDEDLVVAGAAVPDDQADVASGSMTKTVVGGEIGRAHV